MKKFREWFFDLIILLIFIPFMFYLNFVTGIFYCIALFFSVKDKVLFRKKKFSRYFLVGTILTYFSSLLIIKTFNEIEKIDFISLIIISIVTLYLWNKGRNYRKGKY